MAKKNKAKGRILALFAVLGLGLLVVAGLWASSAIFLAVNGIDFNRARPLMIVQYWLKYGSVESVKKTLVLCSIPGALIVLLPPLLIWLAGQKKESLHGDAAFAKTPDINDSGLFKETKDALLIGKFNGRLMYYGGNEFAALAAPTRSGKGVGIIIPNCLNYKGSMIVLDIKGENYDLTSGYRQKVLGQKIFRFSPFTDETHRWNPLSYISKDPAERISQIIQLGYMFYPDKANGDNFFAAAARDLFQACVLYLMDTPSLPLTIGYVLRMGMGMGRPLRDYVVDIVNEDRPEGSEPLSITCVEKFNQIISQSDNTLSGVVGSFTEPLGIWTSAYVDMATSGDDFDFRQLRREGMTIYFNLPPTNVDEARVLINLFYSQALSCNLDALPEQDKSLTTQLLLMMDEFTAAGAITEIKKAVSYIAGYNIRLLMIYQNRSQLESAYGKHDMRTLLSNTRLTIIYTPVADPIQDSQEYSDMLGYKTVRGVSVSRGGNGNRSESQSDQRRALMLPQELRAMPDEDEIVLLRGTPPIKAKKIIYWKDPIFTKRLIGAVPMPKLDVKTFMLKREGKKVPLTAEDVKAGDFNVAELEDIDAIMEGITENMDTAAVEAHIDRFLAEKTGLPEKHIVDLTKKDEA